MINNTVAEAPDTVSNNLDEISKKIQIEQQRNKEQNRIFLAPFLS